MIGRFLSRFNAPKPDEVSAALQRADALIELGDEAERRGDVGGACDCYRRAVDAAPGYGRPHLNLGVGLEALGDIEGAKTSYEAALKLDPQNTNAGYNLGKLLYERGDLSGAQQLLESVLSRRADFAEVQVVLSGVYEAQGRLELAAEQLEETLKQRPQWTGALFNYAGVLKRLGRVGEAEAVLRRLLAIEPDNADGCCELGVLLKDGGALEEAEGLLLRARELKPESQEVYRELFYVHELRGDHAGAAAVLEGAIARWPDWADALRHYGGVLKQVHRLGEAEAALRRALAIEPDVAATHQVLGTVHMVQANIPEALAAFRAARTLDPESFELESSELFALNFSNDISDEGLFDRHRAFGIRLEKTYPLRFQPYRNAADPERRLRIGYVSGDFAFHAVSLFMIPLLERHDRARHEIYCYSVAHASEKDHAVRSRTDHWRAAEGMSHDRLADAINADGIDILVDLSGHSGKSRLQVFAQQPAPVQLTWLGYLNTTGTTRVQYRLCDRHSDPVGLADRFHTETLVRLSNSQWCYRPLATIVCADSPPCLRNGFVTFGSFNQIPKLSPFVRGLWAKILDRVPESRLLIVGISDPGVAKDLLVGFIDAGIARSRVSIAPRVSLEDYFRCYNAVDIALDTTPYSGGTTTCDALWMGVPVITVPGTRSVSRSTASLLASAGLPEWIAASPDDYVRRAAEFSGTPVLLTEIRRTLRQRMKASPLMDEAQFARDVEAAYRTMWRRWCDTAHD